MKLRAYHWDITKQEIKAWAMIGYGDISIIEHIFFLSYTHIKHTQCLL
jgi:hypothetical protein